MSALRRVLLVLSLVLLSVPFAAGPWLIGSTRTWALSLDLAATFLGAALFLFSRAALPAGRFSAGWRLPPAFPAFAAFVLYVALRVPSAAAPFAAAGEALRALALLLLYAALWPIAHEHGLWRVLLAVLLLSAACMAMYALHQHLEHDTSVLWATRPAPYGLRASGAYLCPNHFANWLAMAAAAALALALLPAAGAAMRLAALYALFLAVPGVYLSQSRSAILGLLAAFALLPLAVFGRESKTRFALALLLVPLLAAGAGLLSIRTVPAVKTRFAAVLEDPDRAGGARLRVWRDAVEMYKARPVAGFGPASFMWAYPPFRKNVANTFLWDYPHNEYVGLAVEEGAAGAALFVAGGLWLFGWWAVRLSRTRSRGAAAALAGAGGVV
ncbi:MAG: O-antigen ligase family protein, partial [Kiritimatiellae bacterium]|nr:O-antigen ligase family protein [Kiritimatiellia bacterium]